jgi:MFS family permease
MDLSSEMIHSLLPVYLVSVLGTSTLTLGLIEGVAEGTALISKVFSGVLSDRFARRKPLVVIGYVLAALSKPLFPLANSPALVFCARFFDRIGKGIRGSPRDALLADATPPDVRGAAYGLRQSLDTAGALLGPLAAIVLLNLLNDSVRAVFWVATAPALVSVALLMVAVREPERREVTDSRQSRLPWSDLKRFRRSFWMIVAIGSIVTLARFSEAFLILRASDAGLSLAWTPLALVVMNAAYFVSAYPAGHLSDRVSRVWLLVGGLAVLIIADLLLALGNNVTIVLVGIAIRGLHMGLTQGVFAAMVADRAPAELRGSAFGVFNFVCGLVALLSSLLAGALWKYYGPAAAFYASAAFAAVALAGLIAWARRPAPS